MLPDVVPVAPNGFVVVQAAALNMTQPNSSVALRDPSGTIVDMIAIVPTEPNHSLSRFPVHGGGWTVDTPLTAGQFNQPAPGPSSLPISTQTIDEVVALQEVQTQPVRYKPWMVILVAFFAGLSLLYVLWRRRLP